MKNNWEKIEANPTWDFRNDPELVGKYIGAETEVGPNKSNLYTFKKENGELIAVWGNTILDTRFKNLERGEMIKIVYKGRVKSPKTDREYHDFDVFHKKAEFEEVKNGDMPGVENEHDYED